MTDASKDAATASEPIWRFSLFGTLRVQDPAGTRPEITHFRTQRAAALLAYLALHPQRAHTREALIEILWPDSDPVVARSRLRQELATLRRQLEPGPIVAPGAVLQTIGRELVGLRAGSVQTDVQEFERYLSLSGSQHGAERLRSLRRAVDLHGSSGLLVGRYEVWIDTERERFTALYASAMRAVAEDAVASLADPVALDITYRAVQHEPTDSEAQARLVQRLVADGDVETARRRLTDWERTASEEGFEAPSPQIQHLVQTAVERRMMPQRHISPTPAVTVTQDSPPKPATEAI